MNVTTMMAAALAVAATPAATQSSAPQAAVPAPRAVDPARLAIATRVAGKLLPPGTYKSIMKASMDQMSNGMLDRMFDMPVRSFAKIGGLSDEQAAKIGPATMRQIMAIVDPAYDQRTKLMMRAMGDVMGTIMDAMEPDVRAGLGEALAGRFTLDELTTLDQFFSTTVGASYAAQSMAIYADPAVMQRMQTMLPRMMEMMPDLVKKLDAATAGLPKPRTPEELTPAERAKLKALLADPTAAT